MLIILYNDVSVHYWRTSLCFQPDFCVHKGVCYATETNNTCYTCQTDGSGTTFWETIPGKLIGLKHNDITLTFCFFCESQCLLYYVVSLYRHDCRRVYTVLVYSFIHFIEMTFAVFITFWCIVLYTFYRHDFRCVDTVLVYSFIHFIEMTFAVFITSWCIVLYTFYRHDFRCVYNVLV